MKNTNFKTKDGNSHVIDKRGNHFINGRCVNPLKGEGKIGSTYPNELEIVKTNKDE
jgi:hypothetical protein